MPTLVFLSSSCNVIIIKFIKSLASFGPLFLKIGLITSISFLISIGEKGLFVNLNFYISSGHKLSTKILNELVKQFLLFLL